jgi:hypothetical protein
MKVNRFAIWALSIWCLCASAVSSIAACSQSGCGVTGSEVKTAAKDIWDCTTPNRAALVAQAGPWLESVVVHALSPDSSKVDDTKVVAALEEFAAPAGLCIFASAVKAIKAHSQQALIAQADPGPALDASFERIRSAHYGGARIVLPAPSGDGSR